MQPGVASRSVRPLAHRLCSVHCAAHCLPRSRVYDALENAPRAVKWYRAALQADPFNYEVGAGLLGEAANRFPCSNGF